ncbi:MAG: hypothetical protein Q9196_004987, partial [Gyalolechia fulgens]
HPSALLWQEYSNADARWDTTDPTVVSIELLTVLLAAPLAAYICYLLQSSSSSGSPATAAAALSRAKSSFLMIVLATAELYGGFMTFAPEWLTGSRNLRTERAMWKWVYLAAFNGFWPLINTRKPNPIPTISGK